MRFRSRRCVSVASLFALVALCWIPLPESSAHGPRVGVRVGVGGPRRAVGRSPVSGHNIRVSPAGISYGYRSGSFGVRVGPVGPGRVGPYSRYYGPRTVVAPPRVIAPTRVVVPTTTVVRSVPRPQGPVIVTNQQAAQYQLEAENAFRNQSYEEALQSVDHALLEDQGNGKLHLFAAQALFALGEYEGAWNATIDGARLLPQQNTWGFVVENRRHLYTSVDPYKAQVERLKDFIAKNSNAPYAEGLASYQKAYLSGNSEAINKVTGRLAALIREPLPEAVDPPSR